MDTLIGIINKMTELALDTIMKILDPFPTMRNSTNKTNAAIFQSGLKLLLHSPLLEAKPSA